MPFIPPQIIEYDTVSRETQRHLPLIGRGKVRDTFRIDGNTLFFLASDRLSVYDFVTGSLIPRKGEELTAEKVFWHTEPFHAFPHDLLAYGKDVDRYLPPQFRNRPDVWRRGIVARELDMLPIECIARRYLVGSAWKQYNNPANKYVVNGNQLPEGLREGSKLPDVIFTPTTKSKTGHDEPLTIQEVERQYGKGPEILTLRIFRNGERHLEPRGLILVDTKIELGWDTLHELVLGDEMLTSDSSRFWNARQAKEAEEKGILPESRDKQIARDYFKALPTPWEIKFEDLDPKNKAHQIFAGESKLPEELVSLLKHTYLEGFSIKTGYEDLDAFQRIRMSIPGKR